MQVRYRAALRPAPTTVEYHIRIPDAIASRVGYFQHALASDFGLSADASAATPANYAVPNACFAQSVVARDSRSATLRCNLAFRFASYPFLTAYAPPAVAKYSPNCVASGALKIPPAPIR